MLSKKLTAYGIVHFPLFKAKELFDEQGVEIPYPKRDIYVKGKL